VPVARHERRNCEAGAQVNKRQRVAERVCAVAVRISVAQAEFALHVGSKALDAAGEHNARVKSADSNGRCNLSCTQIHRRQRRAHFARSIPAVQSVPQAQLAVYAPMVRDEFP